VKNPLANPEPLIRRVYSYVAYRIGDGPDAEDVTSEVFERALRYQHTFDPRSGTPVAWLIGIARRAVDDAYAARRPIPVAETDDVAGAADLEADAVRRLTVRAAVEQLSERDRELVALRFGADLTARQIAELLGATTNGVEVALHRALTKLRGQLEEIPQPPEQSAKPRLAEAL
jgi:RNA polymerase sigma-70 factor (ECF subfamily)